MPTTTNGRHGACPAPATPAEPTLHSSHPTRRRLLQGLAAAPLAGAPAVLRAQAPHELKFGHNLPASHPLHLRAQEAATRLQAESRGRLTLRVFPNNQLGGDTDMLAQVRSGGLDIFNAGTMVIATVAPLSAITALGFAFKDHDQVWRAVDGALGQAIRAAFARIGLHTFERMWDNGFRQITSSLRPVASAADLAGMKVRVPVSPMGISLFKALRASLASLQFSEVYSALQTRVVDAQENPLAIVHTAKLYEVQKFCSLTRHSWDGYHMVMNGRAWRALPDDLKSLLARVINDAGLQQRQDVQRLNQSLQAELSTLGLRFNEAPQDSFRELLRQSGYYAEWKARFGPQAWSLLEAVAGQVS